MTKKRAANYPAGAATRMSQWEEPRDLGFGVIGNCDNSKRIVALHKELNSHKTPEENGLTLNRLIRSCRELIYDEKDGKIIFHAISHYINPEKMTIEAGPLFELSSSADEGRSEEEETIDILAVAAMEEVPVYPNRADQVGKLANLHRQLLTEGFTAPDGAGNRVRLKFAKRPTNEFLDINKIGEIDCSISIFPAEVALIREVAMREITRLSRAEAVLSSLERAIQELEHEISVDRRNENSIQRCITRNPILFGVEYIDIIPKHRLGSEYEMDYAGKRFNGSYDLIELESSNLAVYTKGGNPSQSVVHAEQQVLDWLAWIEENHPYAAQGLVGISNPMGFVVIGRRAHLSRTSAEKLRLRNIYWNGRIQILTYDDLLDRAKSIRTRLNLDLSNGVGIGRALQ